MADVPEGFIPDEPEGFEAEGPQIAPGSPISYTPVQELVRKYGPLLPTSGGLVGGFAGGTAGTVFGAGVGGYPGAVGGAALGGAGGEAARQLLNRAVGLEAPETSGQAAAQIGLRGLEQAGQETLGQGLAAGTVKAGQALMGSVLGPAGLGAKFSPAATAIKEGIQSGRAGFAKVIGKIMESDRAAQRLVSRVIRTRVQPISQVALPVLNRVASELADSPIHGEAIAAAQKYTRAFIRDNPGPMTAKRLWEAKKQADRIAAPIYKKIESKEPVTAGQVVKATWNKAFADQAREILHGSGANPPLVPGLKDVEDRTAELIGLKRALRKSARGEVPFVSRAAGRGATGAVAGGTAALVSPGDVRAKATHAAEAAALATLLASPNNLSQLALLLSSPIAQLIARQVPRTGAAITQGEAP